jgi:hypothetical protein
MDYLEYDYKEDGAWLKVRKRHLLYSSTVCEGRVLFEEGLNHSAGVVVIRPLLRSVEQGDMLGVYGQWFCSETESLVTGYSETALYKTEIQGVTLHRVDECNILLVVTSTYMHKPMVDVVGFSFTPTGKTLDVGVRPFMMYRTKITEEGTYYQCRSADDHTVYLHSPDGVASPTLISLSDEQRRLLG